MHLVWVWRRISLRVIVPADTRLGCKVVSYPRRRGRLHAWLVIRIGAVMPLLRSSVVYHGIRRRVRSVIGVRMILSELVIVVEGVVAVGLILRRSMVRNGWPNVEAIHIPVDRQGEEVDRPLLFYFNAFRSQVTFTGFLAVNVKILKGNIAEVKEPLTNSQLTG